MNTTKLHIIAKALLKETKRVGANALLEQSAAHLRNLINQPQQPNHQRQLSGTLSALYNKLANSPVDDFSPAWRDALEELGVADEFGLRLERKIKDIFERNQITQQTALEEIEAIQKTLSQTENNLNGLVNGLNYFNVGEDSLKANQCEIGIIVPRSYVKDNLRRFGSELIELEKMLLVFSELATGNREPLKIRQISSSELSVFLDYIPQVGACIAIAVERIVALYKQMLEIKKLKLELRNLKVPDENLKGIEEHAESLVKPKLDEIADELLNAYDRSSNSERHNEICIELRHSLYKLANRIDRGFNIELRVSLPEDRTDEDQQSENDDLDTAINQIMDSSSKIQHVRLIGAPVLFLPENDRDDSQDDDEQPPHNSGDGNRAGQRKIRNRRKKD